MANIPEDVKKLIRAVVSSKDGGVLENQFRNDFAKVANQNLDYQKYGFQSLKTLLQSIPDVVRVEFDKHRNLNRYLGVPIPGQFLSKPAKKAMRLHGSDSDSDESNGRREWTHDRKSTGSVFERTSNGSDESSSKEDLKIQLIGSANDKGLYSLCFPQSSIKQYGAQVVKDDFRSVGEVVEESSCKSMLFVRYRSLAEAQGTVEKLADKYRIIVPMDRLRAQRQAKAAAESSKRWQVKKERKVTSQNPRSAQFSGPQNELTLAVKPSPNTRLATEHHLDPSLPIVCIRNLPVGTPAHILMRELEIPLAPDKSNFSKKYDQSIAFTAFPNDDGCGETAAKDFIKRFQGHVIDGQPISLSIVSGVTSSDDTLTSTSEDTIDMESLQSSLVDDVESGLSQHCDSSVDFCRTIADDDSSIVSCRIGSYRYGQTDDAVSDEPPGLEGEDDFLPGLDLDDSVYVATSADLEGPPGLEDDITSEGNSGQSDILIRLKLYGFPYNTTTEELLTVLRPFGVDEVRLLNNTDHYHTTKAQIKVTMHQAHHIIQALDNSVFKNRTLNIAPDLKSKVLMLNYAKAADPAAFPENVPNQFQPPKLEQLMLECGTFKFLASSIDVNARMPVYVTHVERENRDYLWAVRTADYAGLVSLDNRLQKFRSDRNSRAKRGIIRDGEGIWHRVWVSAILPDNYLLVVSVDRGRPFTVRRSDYYYLPDAFWNSETPFAIPMKICERCRGDIKILANKGIYHVTPVDLIDSVLYVAV